MTGFEIALVAIAASAAAAGTAAYSEHQSKEMQKKAVKYQEQGEKRALELRTEQRREKLRQLIATQRAGYAGLGVDPTMGSAMSTTAGSAFFAGKDMAVDQEMTGRELGGLKYQRRVLAYEQSLIPYKYGTQFAADAATIYAGYKAAQPPAGAAGADARASVFEARTAGGRPTWTPYNITSRSASGRPTWIPRA
jgi:hypothetical protein